MKKDIEIPEVKNVHVAAVKDTTPGQEESWNVFVVNNRNEMIDTVMVTSKGYMTDKFGHETKTSVMRHKLGAVPAKTAVKIEPITPEVFQLNNEYWVTFFAENKLFEKKFIFGSDTIVPELEEDVPVLNVKGVVVW